MIVKFIESLGFYKMKSKPGARPSALPVLGGPPGREACCAACEASATQTKTIFTRTEADRARRRPPSNRRITHREMEPKTRVRGRGGR